MLMNMQKRKSAIASALLTALFVAGLFMALVPAAVAQCPEGCVQRSSYCDCPSQDPNASISTTCGPEYECELGFVCDPQTQTCRLAGGEEAVAAPEGDFAIVALIFAMAGAVFLLKK